MELHILNETGMVVLLDDEMRIIKPVYDYLKFQRQRDRVCQVKCVSLIFQPLALLAAV